jgi:hypothetical protein
MSSPSIVFHREAAPGRARAAASAPCRLCGADAALHFVRRHCDGEQVAYYLCEGCGSLQTQAPHWLDEAYAKSDAPDLDTFAGERALRNRAFVALLFRLCGLDPRTDRLVDWGGGTGLLVRLLRDGGIDAYHYDRYERNHYASGFGFDPRMRHRFATAFEVWEHYPHPARELDEIFGLAPDFLLVSTSLFDGQGPDWEYLGPAKSQHVFFYSDRAMRRIADERGYRFARFPPSYCLFFRGAVPALALGAMARLAWHPRWLELAFVLSRRRSLAGHDNAVLRAIVEAGEGAATDRRRS